MWGCMSSWCVHVGGWCVSSWCVQRGACHLGAYMWRGVYVVLVRTCGGMVCVVLVCTEGCMSSWCVHVERGVCRLGAYMWGRGVCHLNAYMRGRGVCRLGAYVRGCMSS